MNRSRRCGIGSSPLRKKSSRTGSGTASTSKQPHLIENKQYEAARRVLRNIVDDNQLTNISIEAKQLLESLPPKDAKTRTYVIPLIA